MQLENYTLLVEVYASGFTTTTVISSDDKPESHGDPSGEHLSTLQSRFRAEGIDVEFCRVSSESKKDLPDVWVHKYKFQASEEQMRRLGFFGVGSPLGR